MCKMNLLTEEEIFDKLVPADSAYRKLNELFDFVSLVSPYRDLYSDLGRKGYDIEQGVRALLVQFWAKHSDRELEIAIRENITIRWFCGFGLTEKTPDHTYFCILRDRLGAKNIAELFNRINQKLRERNLFGDVFKFVDASSIVSNLALWEARDRAIKKGQETLNNTNVSEYTVDKEARWGAKSKTKYWYGYKQHNCVDMKHGLIDRIAVTSADILDHQGFELVCPSRGMIFADKGYDVSEVHNILDNRGCVDGIIQKNNRAGKSRDLDRWRSGVRSPYEGTFSKMSKRARYRGTDKVSIQYYFEAIIHNLKKAIRILSPAQA